MFNRKKKCDCGKMAVWLYMPSSDNKINPFYCNDCVPRGCTCNWHTVRNMDNFQPSEFHDENQPPTDSNDWKWVVRSSEEEYGPIEEGKIWVYLDEKGRESPCAEFDYDEKGRESPCAEFDYDEEGYEDSLKDWVVQYIKNWWKRHIVDKCPPEHDY